MSVQSIDFEENSSQNNTRASSVLFAVLLWTLSVICVLLSAAVLFLSLSKTPENTLEVFGYKAYCAESSIEEIGIKAGSLVVVKDTDTDDYYTYQSLSENIVFSVEKLGYALKYNSLWITLCFTVPLMLFFLLTIMSEFKKLSIKRAEQRLYSERKNDSNELPDAYQDEFDVTV